jgi:hypothetical protein
METLNRIVQVPAWAYDFCYYYLILAAIVVIYTLWGAVQLIFAPAFAKRVIPSLGLVLALLISGGLTVALSMMQFWICRSSLAPKATEKFAVACKSGSDCLAVNGTPQSSQCTCGARGLCGGCVMRNNMEPQPEFLAEFA